jgi:hypothetical protein
LGLRADGTQRLTHAAPEGTAKVGLRAPRRDSGAAQRARASAGIPGYPMQVLYPGERTVSTEWNAVGAHTTAGGRRGGVHGRSVGWGSRHICASGPWSRGSVVAALSHGRRGGTRVHPPDGMAASRQRSAGRELSESADAPRVAVTASWSPAARAAPHHDDALPAHLPR